MIFGMRALSWEPVPGKQGMHIPVDVNDNGEDPGGDSGREVDPTEALDDEIALETRSGIHKPHVSERQSPSMEH